MKVVVRMPSRGQPTQEAAGFLLCWLAKQRPDWDIAIHRNKEAVDLARCEIVAIARQRDADYLIMIDDDVVPTAAVLDMPQKDVPILAGLVPTWNEGYFFWNAYRWRGEEGKQRLVPINTFEMGQLEEVDSCGAAILCLSREILFRKDMDPLFEFNRMPTGVKTLRGGEDFTFCRKARTQGYSIQIDPAVQGEHMARIGLLETMQKIHQQGRKYVTTFGNRPGEATLLDELFEPKSGQPQPVPDHVRKMLQVHA